MLSARKWVNSDEKWRYKKVLLCIPPFPGSFPWFHPGIGYLSEFLTKNGIVNWVCDLRLGYTTEDLLHWIKELKPDLIGVTTMTFRHDIPYDIISKIKSSDYDIVVGGPHVSTFRSKVLEDCDADFAIKLEGEYPLLELCQGMEFADIKGLIYRNGPHVIENRDRPFIRNLDSIPFPRYEKTELGRYGRVIPIISSRGCPYLCIYCPIRVTMGGVWRSRSAENVVKEMGYWYNRGYRTFDFLDDNFTLMNDRVYAICDLIEKRNLAGLELHCSNGVRADRIDRDLLKRMREVGFNYLCFGVEAGSNKVLQRIKKGCNIETVEQAIKNACELGYEVGLFFMVGHPEETPSDVENSIKLALKYPVTMANFYNIIPFPSTELFEWVKENNYFVGKWHEKLNYSAHLDRNPFFETPEFPLLERKKMLARTAKISKEIKRKSVERKLTRKFGSLGKNLTQILYSDALYGLARQTYFRSGTMRRMVDALRGRLKIYHI